MELRRSALVENMSRLLAEGAIAFDDLDGFSDTLVETLKMLRKSDL